MIVSYSLIIISFKNIDQIHDFFNFWVGFAFINSLVTIIQVILGEKYFLTNILYPNLIESLNIYSLDITGEKYISGYGLFHSPRYNSLFLQYSLLIVFVNLLMKKRSVIYNVFSFLLIVLALTATQSRASLFIAAFCILFSFYLYKSKGGFKIKYGISILFILGFIFMFLATRYEAVQNIFSAIYYRYQSLGDSYIWRYNIWLSSINMLTDVKDYFFGLGLGTTGNFSYAFEVHNSYLELFVELGIVGFSMWAIFHFIAIKKGLWALSQHADRRYFSIAIISFLMLLSATAYCSIGMSIRQGDLLIIFPFALVQVCTYMMKENNTDNA